MSPTETVTSFLNEMLNWEKLRRSEQKNPLFKENSDYRNTASQKSLEALVKIFQKYVENGLENKLTDSRIASLSTSTPSEFDQKITTSTGSNKIAEVITKQESGFEEYLKYIMKENSGEWKISKLFTSLDGVDWEKRRAL